MEEASKSRHDNLDLWFYFAVPTPGMHISPEFAETLRQAHEEHSARQQEKKNKPPRPPRRPNAPTAAGRLALGHSF